MNMYVGDKPKDKKPCWKHLSNRSMWRCTREEGHDGPCALVDRPLHAAFPSPEYAIPAPTPHDVPVAQVKSALGPLKKRYRVTVSVEEVLVKSSGKEALVPITKAAAGVDLSTFDFLVLHSDVGDDQARAHYMGQALTAAAAKCTHHVQKQVFVYHRDID